MTGCHSAFRRLATCAAFVLLVAARAPAPGHAAAASQADTADLDGLREQVLELFDVVPRQPGVGLIPRTELDDVVLIEIADGVISINRQIVSGRELGERLPSDAGSLVLRLSYLDDEIRRQLLAPTGPPEVQADDPGVTDAPVAPPARRPDRRARDIVRFGMNVTISPDEEVPGNVFVLGGDATIDGEVDGDVVVIAGTLRLGDTADIDGSVFATGRLIRAPGARIRGDLIDVSLSNPEIRFGDVELPNVFRRPTAFPRFMGVATTLLRLGLLVILGWLIVAVAGGPVRRISSRAAAEPFKAGLVGILVELLFLPMLVLVSVLLAVSIVGIPLLALVPVAVLIMVVVLLVGFTAVAMRVGEWMGVRVGTVGPAGYGAVTAGIAVVLALALLARLAFLSGGVATGLGVALAVIGFGVEFAAWTVGLGAAVLVRFAPDSRPAGPTAPPVSQPPPEMPPATI